MSYQTEKLLQMLAGVEPATKPKSKFHTLLESYPTMDSMLEDCMAVISSAETLDTHCRVIENMDSDSIEYDYIKYNGDDMGDDLQKDLRRSIAKLKQTLEHF